MIGSVDILILLKLCTIKDTKWSQISLAKELGLSSRVINHGLKKAHVARLYDPTRRTPIRSALTEAMVKGIRYFIPVELGEMTRGIPTAWAAPPLSEALLPSNDPPPVWPSSEGTVRGQTIIPLHSNVPGLCINDPDLYELLALVDAIRCGNARERNLASELLTKRLLSQ